MLAGCAGAPLDVEVPNRFNLDGDWLLVASMSDEPPAPTREQRLPMGRGQSRRAPPGLGLAFVRHDFPGLSARQLHIEQSRDSMGVRYDGSEYRDVSWGERERGLWRVNAGWNENGDLVIRYRASDAKAQEIYSLDPKDDRLRLAIEINTDREDVSVVRVFERI